MALWQGTPTRSTAYREMGSRYVTFAIAGGLSLLALALLT